MLYQIKSSNIRFVKSILKKSFENIFLDNPKILFEKEESKLLELKNNMSSNGKKRN